MTPLDIESIERRAALPDEYAFIVEEWGLDQPARTLVGAAVAYAHLSERHPLYKKQGELVDQHMNDLRAVCRSQADVPELVREVKRLRAIEEAARVVATGAAIFVYTGDIEDALVALDIALQAYDKATHPLKPLPLKSRAAVSDVGDTTGVISGTRKEQEP